MLILEVVFISASDESVNLRRGEESNVLTGVRSQARRGGSDRPALPGHIVQRECSKNVLSFLMYISSIPPQTSGRRSEQNRTAEVGRIKRARRLAKCLLFVLKPLPEGGYENIQLSAGNRSQVGVWQWLSSSGDVVPVGSQNPPGRFTGSYRKHAKVLRKHPRLQKYVNS